MSTIFARIRSSIVLALVSLTLFTTSYLAQDVASRTNGSDKDVLSIPLAQSNDDPKKNVAGSTSNTGEPAKEFSAEPGNGKSGLEAEVAAIKAENAAVKEQLRRMEAAQRILIEQLNALRLRLDRNARLAASNPQPVAAPGSSGAVTSPDDASSNDQQTATDNAGTSTAAATDSDTVATKASTAKQVLDNRYQEGIIIWKTPDDAPVPFMLRFNNNTQLRYLNTLSSNDTFTDHLGVVRPVSRRNDITVNRSMFILGGYIWDKRLIYSLTVWTSAGAASIVVAGNIGWQFNKRFTLIAGYTGVPGSRSLVNTFPYFTATDRSMADNFFRPGFTQGVWMYGEALKGLNYQAFVGNALNSINISASKIDTNLLVSGSVWWEPLGQYGKPGKSVNMYDDYFAEKKTRIRLGTSFTRSREDRFSNLDQSNPENTSLYNSDGVLTFSTGAFAPGVTVDKALYQMWAIDGGIKYNGLAVNGQYFMRWLGEFEADGPLPLDSTYDHGYELSASYFVIPKKLILYGRSSQVFGQFGNSYEYAGGVKWHFLPTERLWLNAEVMRVHKSPYNGAFTPYTAGMDGWMPMLQTIIAF